MQDKIEICGVNTARLKDLTQKQMDALLLWAKEGDENARQELIEDIAVLQQEGGCDEAIRVWEEVSSELPIIRWSDTALRDTVDPFIAETGRVPTATDLKKPPIPPYRVFMCNYGLTLAE